MSRRGKRQRAEESRGNRSAASQQTRAGPAGYSHAASGPGNSAVAATLEAGGLPLDAGTRLTMQHTFGADFGDVRVHTGAGADASARDLEARAFTRGSDVGFRSGMYNPQTASGQGLLAHELAHVLQQRSASHNGRATPNGTASLEGEARGASRAVQAGAQTIPVSQPSAAPAVQCDGILDYIPGGNTAASLAGDLWESLGQVDTATVNNTVERVLSSRVMRGLLLGNPALAPHAGTLEFLAAHPGSLQAIWSFMVNPQPKIDALQDKLRPHIMQGISTARMQSEELLRSLGVPEPHVATAGRVLQGAASFALGAAEFVIDEVLVDTIAFWQLGSERRSYDEAWQKYDAGLIDTHDIIVEHLAFALSVLGRIEDIVSVILWIAGIGGGGAAGGTVGSVVPVAGTAAGAGGGGAAGGGVGLAASEVVGIIASLGPGALELERMIKATGDLLLAEQTPEQQNEDYAQIASGAVTLAVMAVLAFLPGLALRLGRRLASKIRRMLPEISTLLPAAARAVAAPAVPVRRAARSQPAAEVGTAADTPRIEAAPAAARAEPNVEPSRPADVPASNVRAFPAERVQPARVRETPGDLVEGRLGPRPQPERPEPPRPESARAAVPNEMNAELRRTGTDDRPYQPAPRSTSPDRPRAMADEPSGPVSPTPQAPPTPALGGGRDEPELVTGGTARETPSRETPTPESGAGPHEVVEGESTQPDLAATDEGETQSLADILREVLEETAEDKPWPSPQSVGGAPSPTSAGSQARRAQRTPLGPYTSHTRSVRRVRQPVVEQGPALRKEEVPDVTTEERAAVAASEARRERVAQTSEALPSVLRDKTVAEGEVETISGIHALTTERLENIAPRSVHLAERFADVTTEDVAEYARRIGHELPTSGAFDLETQGGFEGAYFASHAEKKHAVARPDAPVTVSLPMCDDCIPFYRRHAMARGSPQVVTDPEATRVFHPDGSITEFWKSGVEIRYGSDGQTVSARPQRR